MTITEICDDLARRAGWSKYTASNGIQVWERGGFAPELGMEPYQQSHAHPFPLTLDAAAGAMPDGYSVKVIVHKGSVQATAWPSTLDRLPSERSPYFSSVIFVDIGDETEARYRVAHAAWVAMEKENNNG